MTLAKVFSIKDTKVGDSLSFDHILNKKDVELFAIIAHGIHMLEKDVTKTERHPYFKMKVNDMWGETLLTTFFGGRLSGGEEIYIDPSLFFHSSLVTGDIINLSVSVIKINKKTEEIHFQCHVINTRTNEEIQGIAIIHVQKVMDNNKRNEFKPCVNISNPTELYEIITSHISIEMPVKTAVINPVDELSLLGAIESAKALLIDPILIGCERTIKTTAKKLNISLDSYLVKNTTTPAHAAALGAQLAYEGEVDALMKGALHTDELMHAVLHKDYTLVSERRMSHVFVLKIDTYPKLLFVTDAALNINPSVDEKKDIIQNAIDFATLLDVNMPKVAILSAVETVSLKMQSTLDAAALCKMADRGQINGGILDGPLAFDNVISKEAAKIKEIHSPVSGEVDIIVVPNLEAGNILVKQLEYLSGAQSAGLVLGARVPIILTSRADKPASRLSSSALANLMICKRKHEGKV